MRRLMMVARFGASFIDTERPKCAGKKKVAVSDPGRYRQLPQLAPAVLAFLGFSIVPNPLHSSLLWSAAEMDQRKSPLTQ